LLLPQAHTAVAAYDYRMPTVTQKYPAQGRR